MGDAEELGVRGTGEEDDVLGFPQRSSSQPSFLAAVWRAAVAS